MESCKKFIIILVSNNTVPISYFHERNVKDKIIVVDSQYLKFLFQNLVWALIYYDNIVLIRV